MKKKLAIYIILAFANISFFSQQNIIKITYENLLKHEFFNEDEGQGPGNTFFNPTKFQTVFIWPGNIIKMNEKDMKKIKKLLNNDDFAKLFTYYVDIESEVNVVWSKDKVLRKTRIYLQNNLMKYINKELIKGDKVDTTYWVFGPFDAFEQIINCFMVAYQEIN